VTKFPRRTKSYAEQDAYNKFWRKHIVWTRGELRKIKKQTHKRERREGRSYTRNEE
jgi:hypothetical protein